MYDFDEREAFDRARRMGENVGPEELGGIVDRVVEKLSSSLPESLRSALIHLVKVARAIASGCYKPGAGTIAAVAGALLYFLMVVDLVPDFIPIAGWLDDAAVATTALSLLSLDVDELDCD